MVNPGMRSMDMQVTLLLREAKPGNQEAIDRLLPLVYDELRKLAHRQHIHFSNMQTLNTTALVHEAYLKLVGQGKSDWESRNQFFYIAARAMRQILLDYARAKKSQKRGGDLVRLDLDDTMLLTDDEADEILALDAALAQLNDLNARQAQIVECRFFAGMTIEETAAVMGLSVPTVNRDWRVARAWLYKQLRQDIPGVE